MGPRPSTALACFPGLWASYNSSFHKNQVGPSEGRITETLDPWGRGREGSLVPCGPGSTTHWSAKRFAKLTSATAGGRPYEELMATDNKFELRYRRQHITFYSIYNSTYQSVPYDRTKIYMYVQKITKV